MFITREADYAIRVLRAVSGGKRCTVGEICSREVLPQQFVYKILKKLEQAGLLKITRGARGGCALAGSLRETSLYDLMNALDGNMTISGCVREGYECEWQQQHSMPCVVHKQLMRMQESFDKKLRECSLHKLIFGVD
jgi:Rrf2 family protein